MNTINNKGKTSPDVHRGTISNGVKCKEVLEKLVVFLDGEVGNDLNGQISRHLESCNICNKEARLLSKTWNILDKFPELEPDEKVIRQIQEKVRAINNHPEIFRDWRWRWLRIAVFPTVVGLLIALGLYFIPLKRDNLKPSAYPSPVITTADNKAQEELQAKLNYYKELLARFQEVKEEDYWSENDSKLLSPYLFSDEWDF